ncbi:MAG TPA: hypothetical protein VFG35_25930 [Actinoplanes sp.]|nr:hypothetical protein [Actinoplanes sp.]
MQYGGFTGALGLVIACALVYFVWSVARSYLRSDKTLSTDNLADVFSSAVDSVRHPLMSFGERIRVLLGPEHLPYQEILKREVEDYYAAEPQTLLDAAENISPNLLSNVAVSMNISLERMHHLANDEQKKMIETTPHETMLQYRVRRIPEVTELARQIVIEQLKTDSNARFQFTTQVFNLGPMHESLQGRIEDAKVYLRKENNELYQEYDRMVAEGEFRRGVAIPLLGLIAVVSIAALKSLSIPVETQNLTIPAITAIVISGSIYRAGTNRLRESLAFMYSCVNSGYAGLGERKIFGEAMFVPQETNGFVRRSEFSYKFEEFRGDLKSRALDLARKLLRMPRRSQDTPAAD